ncbi:MAG: hypothetical protein WBQ44_06770 [Rhodococcus sp. (in: high G+C Gram-positive bacteria)]
MTEHRSDPDRPVRRWKIPTRVLGRARTSTVLLGICFVLTALLYGQVRPEPVGTVELPQPPTSSEVEQAPVQEQSSEAPSATVTSTTTAVPSSTEGESNSTDAPGGPGSSTPGGTSSTTQDPTFLPGMTVPPQLRSLLPPTPSATGAP